MLFGYPVEATTDNWLHDCFCEILKSIHASLKAAQTPLAWPNIIPPLYRNRLKTHTGLKNKLDAYTKALRKLNLTKQEQVIKALNDQNEIALLLSCQHNCETISDLPQAIHAPVKNLFEFVFSLLIDLEVRDKHYKEIYHAMPAHVCPFCGCEPFNAPEGRREALDHYLPKQQYPFAAANLRNLVPMGHKCNSSYKLSQDMIKQSNGLPRKSFDPYNHGEVSLSLDKSLPFAGNRGQVPLWQIEFVPNIEEVKTWDDVFHIRERYKRDVLDELFKSWLTDFRSWCKSANIAPVSDQQLPDTIHDYAIYYESMGFRDRAFLKAAVFRMLYVHCQQGNKRVFELMKDTVNGIV